ncbi:hypothetical protein [Novosphingobium clariflavum]|uniref:Uncharacterized protein n=1 Tax=Novosphingobium clariflavum TaxID=2029884 RepID=A0ABV6S2W8_9SPHN|nr:hypothetical protein [Novosphingobium clariflavum]
MTNSRIHSSHCACLLCAPPHPHDFRPTRGFRAALFMTGAALIAAGIRCGIAAFHAWSAL